MNELLKLLIELIFVFANSGDDQIDADFSVGQLERISVALKRLDPETRKAFLLKINEEAAKEEGLGNEDRAEQLRQMPIDLGLE